MIVRTLVTTPLPMTHLMNTYARLPVDFVRGEGAWLHAADGTRYLDAIAGIGVCNLGHAHPEIAEVIAEQARTLIHTANLAGIPYQEALGERLCDVAGMERVFIANSGAEAIECALKLARLTGHDHGIDRPAVMVAEQSFHGRTLAAISASHSKKIQQGFEPLVGGFHRVPFGDAAAVETALGDNPDITAVLLEPVQGEAGVRIPPDDYLQRVRTACERHGVLMIADEIQSGLCRTGKWFACDHENVRPDIVTVAKALGNGIPVAACLARGDAAVAFTPGTHGSTFGGNPLACRTALKVLEILERDGMAGRAAVSGARILDQLRTRLEGTSGIVDVRGRGLMIGVELDRPAAAVREAALKAGVLINVTRDNTVRLLPPLIIDAGQAHRIAETVADSVRALLRAA